MAPASRLGRQIAEVAGALTEANVPFALIGGLTLAAHKVVRATQDVDLLFASRPIARRLLAEAGDRVMPFGNLHVVSPEGLIGLKLQALINDPRRTQDLEDIRALLRANRDLLNMAEVRDYFRLFDHEAMLDGLLEESI